MNAEIMTVVETMTDAEKAQIARDAALAADILDDTGWCQGQYHQYGVDRTPISHCLVGAIVVAAGQENPNYRWNAAQPVWTAVAEHLALPERIHDRDDDEVDFEARVIEWNDTEGRTQDEVTGVLRDVAAKFAPDESGATL